MKISKDTTISITYAMIGGVVIALLTGVSMWEKGTGDRWPCHRMAEDRAAVNQARCEADLKTAGVVASVRYPAITCGED